MVAKGEPVAGNAFKRRMACAPRSRFQAVAILACEVHMKQRERNGKRGAARGAGARPVVRTRIQAVMNVGGLQVKAGFSAQRIEQMEQHHRIDAAGQRAAHPAAGADAGSGEHG